jgi:hypothetical protein
MKVQLHNADIDDLFVTVEDLNTQNHNTVFNDRLNKGDTKDIDIQEDGNGRGSVTWNATRVDDPQKTASRTESDLDNLASVDITTTFG